MERFFVSLLMLCILLLLVACGGDLPEAAAKEWMTAFANLDGNKIAERTCAAQQPNVQQAGKGGKWKWCGQWQTNTQRAASNICPAIPEVRAFWRDVFCVGNVTCISQDTLRRNRRAKFHALS